MMDTKRKRCNSKGFTLIELLATIAVLSIIITIVIYFSMKVVNNSKEKSYAEPVSSKIPLNVNVAAPEYGKVTVVEMMK